MEQIYCVNCLREVPAYPCPLCGHDPARIPEVSQSLKQCILHGRYLTGRATEKNGFEIIYRGLDLSEKAPVTILEFFPAGKALRKADGSVSWVIPPVQNRESMLTRVRGQLPRDAILDSFSENGTIYIVCKPRSHMVPSPPKPKQSEWLPFLLALLVLALTTLAIAPWAMTLL